MLTTVFFPKEEAPFYRKAVVADEEVSWFLSKGAKTAAEFNLAMAEKDKPAETEEGGEDDA